MPSIKIGGILMKTLALTFLISLSAVASDFSPVGATISKLASKEKIFLACQESNGSVCSVHQFVLEKSDGSQELLGTEIENINEQKIIDLFLTDEGCYRIKPCLKERFSVGSRKFMRMTAPYSLTQKMGERRLNEAMIGTVPVDTILLPALLPIHGTVAMISTLRKAMFKKVAKELLEGNKEMTLRKKHFEGLIEEINSL